MPSQSAPPESLPASSAAGVYGPARNGATSAIARSARLNWESGKVVTPVKSASQVA